MTDIWSYYIPNNDKHEGWGKFILDSTGYFSCVTDYGNYAFWWTHHGEDDFRKFFVGIGEDYLMGKLAMGKREFDLESSLEKMRRQAIEARRSTLRKRVTDPEIWGVSKAYLREAWEAMDQAGSERECINIVDEHYRCFPDTCELFTYGHPFELRAFCKRLLPRLVEEMKKDLEKTGAKK